MRCARHLGGREGKSGFVFIEADVDGIFSLERDICLIQPENNSITAVMFDCRCPECLNLPISFYGVEEWNRRRPNARVTVSLDIPVTCLHQTTLQRIFLPNSEVELPH